MMNSLLKGLSPLNSDNRSWTPLHYYVNEGVARIAPLSTSYAGTVRMIGAGQTYSTITAAIAAASSGDILQLIDGTYDMKDEANAYLLWNSTTKNLLLRGNVNDPTAVTITQTGSSNYCIRFYNTAIVRIESLTIAQTKIFANIAADWQSAAISHSFKNVIFTNSSNDAAAGFYSLGNTASSALTSRVEFDGCTFTKATSLSLGGFVFTNIGANFQLLWKDCTFNTTSTSAINIPGNGHTCKIAIYDCNFNQNSDTITISLGNDGSAATANLGLIDIRDCDIVYLTTKGQHGLLLGRGVVSCYVVNNRISSDRQNSANIGISFKATPATLGDCIVAGNYIIAFRPILFKGASKNKAQWNTFISNDASNTFYGVEMSNLDNTIQSDDNDLRYNLCYGKKAGIGLGTDATDPTNLEAIQTWTCDYNAYYSAGGVFAYDGAATTEYQFSEKATFWGGTNDAHSRMAATNTVTISAIKKNVV